VKLRVMKLQDLKLLGFQVVLGSLQREGLEFGLGLRRRLGLVLMWWLGEGSGLEEGLELVVPDYCLPLQE
jgi:hypothetical protein